MAKVYTKHLKEITLVLSEDEAQYIRDLLRKYLGEGLEGNETKRLREELFDAIACGLAED